jgi:hypothetical protein
VGAWQLVALVTQPWGPAARARPGSDALSSDAARPWPQPSLTCAAGLRFAASCVLHPPLRSARQLAAPRPSSRWLAALAQCLAVALSRSAAAVCVRRAGASQLHRSRCARRGWRWAPGPGRLQSPGSSVLPYSRVDMALILSSGVNPSWWIWRGADSLARGRVRSCQHRTGRAMARSNRAPGSLLWCRGCKARGLGLLARPSETRAWAPRPILLSPGA